MKTAFCLVALFASSAFAEEASLSATLKTVKSAHALYFESAEPGHEPTKDVKLHSAQLAAALKTLRNGKAFGHDDPVCFTPHHGLQLFDKAGEKIASIELSLACARITSDELDLPLALSPEGVKLWTKLFKEAGLSTSDQPWQ